MDNNIEISFIAPQGTDLTKLLSNVEDIKFDLESRTAEIGFGSGIPKELLDFAVTFGTNITFGVLGNLVYDKLKGHISKLWINSKKVNIDREEIKEAIRQVLAERTPEAQKSIGRQGDKSKKSKKKGR